MSVEACTRFVFRCPFLYFSYILTTLHCAEHCLVRWIDDVSAFWPAAEARSETTRRPPVRGERDLKWERAEGWHKSNVRVPVLIIYGSHPVLKLRSSATSARDMRFGLVAPSLLLS